MDVCPRFFCVVLSCVGRGLELGWSPVQGVLPNVQQTHKFRNSEPEQAVNGLYPWRIFSCGIYMWSNTWLSGKEWINNISDIFQEEYILAVSGDSPKGFHEFKHNWSGRYLLWIVINIENRHLHSQFPPKWNTLPGTNQWFYWFL